MQHSSFRAKLLLLTLFFVTANAEAADKIRVACVGDSITWGSRVEDREKNCYPKVLSNLLGAEYVVTNFGKSGHTLLKNGDNPYWRHLPAVDQFQPNIVIIKLGSNDTKPQNWTHKDEFAKDYNELVQHFQKLSSKPRVFVALPAAVVKSNFGITAEVCLQQQPYVRSVAAENNCSVIDTYSPFVGRADLMHADGVHPNVAGAKLMAEIIFTAMTRKENEIQQQLAKQLKSAGIETGELKPLTQLGPSEGVAFASGNSVFIAGLNHSSITFPRLNNPCPKASALVNGELIAAKLSQTNRTWKVAVPAGSLASTFVLELDGEPYVPHQPFVVTADESGNIVLPAHHAAVHGKKLCYEPQPHKNTLGYWIFAEDWAEWQVAIESPGTYEVKVLQGCGKEQGGSKVDIVLGDAKVSFVVEDTGHFQNFKLRSIGEVTIDKSGQYSLQIRPQVKAKNAVMDVRQVQLIKK
ncbi:MAG: acyl-CoA thioesterase-1 [Pirellulaceae bacterium]|jgi:acyl-CoA thioesterase-1